MKRVFVSLLVCIAIAACKGPKDKITIKDENGNVLEGQWTLIDPQNWEGEWKGTRRWNRVTDHDIQEVECLPDLNEHLQSTSSSVHVN